MLLNKLKKAIVGQRDSKNGYSEIQYNTAKYLFNNWRFPVLKVALALLSQLKMFAQQQGQPLHVICSSLVITSSSNSSLLSSSKLSSKDNMEFRSEKMLKYIEGGEFIDRLSHYKLPNKASALLQRNK